jgi:hypothetical protein
VIAHQFIAETHYPSVKEWWLTQDWSVIPLSHLSKNGVIVFDGDLPIVAGWLFETDSAFCLMEFIVANPGVRGPKRDEAIALLFETLKKMAKVRGFKSVFTMSKNDSLSRRLKSSGFNEVDSGVRNFMFNCGGI